MDRWKKTVVKKQDDEFIIIEYEKDKITGEIKKKGQKKTDYDMVLNLWSLIKNEIDVVPDAIKENRYKFPNKTMKEKYTLTYGEIVFLLIDHLNLPVTRDSFNGGRNRTKYYFPLYYNPVKVLQYYDHVRYEKMVQRLKEKFEI